MGGTRDSPESPKPHPAGGRRPILVLQGGGALGAYQAGAFQALAEAGLQPEWVAGVSIGAINGSLIAGNPPEKRVERLHAFWSGITAPTALWPRVQLEAGQRLERNVGALAALLFGQPGFFRPRLPLEWLDRKGTASFYDTGELRSTLERLVDFDRINFAAGGMRLSVGAADVERGTLVYFDSRRQALRPEHVMASGALPPGLAVVEIGDRLYWDGGLVSNTPLEYVMDDPPAGDSLIFQIDLFPARGRRPVDLDEVLERAKDIQYSSRTRAATRAAAARHDLRRQIAALLQRLPADLRDAPAAATLRAAASPAQIDIVHLIYRPAIPQGAEKDFQFDRGTMEARWAQGFADAHRSLAAAPWRAPCPAHRGVRNFDVPAAATSS